MRATAQAPPTPPPVDGSAGASRAAGLARARRRAAGAPQWLWPGTAATLVYAALAVALYWPVQPLSSTHLVQCGCADPALDAWFIAWTPHALLAHVNPLFTNSIEYPYGINLADNTVMPLLGLLAAPITLTLGPVAAVNLLFRLGFVFSAMAMRFVLGRIGCSRRAAFVGGLVYGFSPYMVAQGSYHLNLVFVPLPPLIAWCFFEIVARRRRPPVRTGLRLGAACAAQYLISAEVLADTALVLAIGALALALRYPRAAARGLDHVARGLGAAALVAGVVCGAPIGYGLAGPQHIASIGALGQLENFNLDLLSPLVPTTHELLATPGLRALGSGFVASNLPENGGYLGLSSIALLVATIARKRRARLVRWCALLALVADVLALGRRLSVDNHLSRLPLPFALLARLPLVGLAMPARYSLLVQLFVAAGLAIALDAWAPARRRGPPVTRRLPPAVTFWLLAALAALPMLPRPDYQQPQTLVPTAFLDSAVARSIPPGSVVLTYPYDAPPWNYAMLWQASADFRFKLVGGYGVTPNALDPDFPLIPQPATMYDLFYAAWNGLPLPALDQATLRQLRSFCVGEEVSTIVLDPLRGAYRSVTRDLDAALGPGRSVDGLTVWTDAATRAERLLARTDLHGQ